MFSFSNSIVINRLKIPKSWSVGDGLEQEPSHYPITSLPSFLSYHLSKNIVFDKVYMFILSLKITIYDKPKKTHKNNVVIA